MSVSGLITETKAEVNEQVLVKAGDEAHVSRSMIGVLVDLVASVGVEDIFVVV